MSLLPLFSFSDFAFSLSLFHLFPIDETLAQVIELHGEGDDLALVRPERLRIIPFLVCRLLVYPVIFNVK